MELAGDEAVIRKEGNALVIEPVTRGRLEALLARLEPLADEFPDIDEGVVALDDPEL
jgi:antitoxin VapB